MPRLPRRRRRPRYGSFLATGVLLGLFATIVVVLGPGADVDRRVQLFFYLGLLLSGTGALLAGLAAVVLESRRDTTSTPAAGDGERPADP